MRKYPISDEPTLILGEIFYFHYFWILTDRQSTYLLSVVILLISQCTLARTFSFRCNHVNDHVCHICADSFKVASLIIINCCLCITHVDISKYFCIFHNFVWYAFMRIFLSTDDVILCRNKYRWQRVSQTLPWRRNGRLVKQSSILESEPARDFFFLCHCESQTIMIVGLSILHEKPTWPPKNKIS